MAHERGHLLDLDAWSRRAQYDFFRTYEQPFFQVCAEVQVSATWRRCREEGHSFFLASWFLCVQAANDVVPFRCRLREEGVWVHERVGLATTVLREDESFAFCHLPDLPTFGAFAGPAAEVVRSACLPASTMDDRPDDDALIHGSTLPWLRFTGFSHARRASARDSIPKIVFGRVSQDHRGEHLMPVAVDVHHALMDGIHVARFFQRLEALFVEAPLSEAVGPRAGSPPPRPR